MIGSRIFVSNELAGDLGELLVLFESLNRINLVVVAPNEMVAKTAICNDLFKWVDFSIGKFRAKWSIPFDVRATATPLAGLRGVHRERLFSRQ